MTDDIATLRRIVCDCKTIARQALAIGERCLWQQIGVVNAEAAGLGTSGLLAFSVKAQSTGAEGGQAAGVKFIEPEQQLAAGVLPDMVRMSVGIEHIDDILWDLDRALAAASA